VGIFDYKTMRVILTTIVAMLMIPKQVSAFSGSQSNELKLFYGQTHRFNYQYFHSFELMYVLSRSTCTNSSSIGFGLNLELFNPQDHSVDLNMYFGHLINFSLSPSIRIHDGHLGLNLKPKIGLNFSTRYYNNISNFNLNVRLVYGYDIKMIQQTEFTSLRPHDLSLRVGVSYDLWPYIKKKVQEKVEDSGVGLRIIRFVNKKPPI
jgi:hypothetical protein